MFPLHSGDDEGEEGLLHACGDVSYNEHLDLLKIASAPRMWRCFYKEEGLLLPLSVCSTHVEMFPGIHSPGALRIRLLHACGDVSISRPSALPSALSAPRMWRCFLDENAPPMFVGVCSTHVEMFLAGLYLTSAGVSLLHACGDVSIILISHEDMSKSAPRMWRCFFSISTVLTFDEVCSTHVEMFLTLTGARPSRIGLLHACGDVSRQVPSPSSAAGSAPRMWRCFLH